MEQRLIYEKDVIEKFAEVRDLRTLSTAVIGKVLKSVPTADPVKHGKWIEVQLTRKTKEYQCSECGHWEQIKYPYCNCGARMDGEYPV